MSIKPNYRKGTRYFWVYKATLACDFLGLRSPTIGLHTKRPSPKNRYHRVELTVVRTKREAEALDAKFAKKRARSRARLKATIAKHNAK